MQREDGDRKWYPVGNKARQRDTAPRSRAGEDWSLQSPDSLVAAQEVARK